MIISFRGICVLFLLFCCEEFNECLWWWAIALSIQLCKCVYNTSESEEMKKYKKYDNNPRRHQTEWQTNSFFFFLTNLKDGVLFFVGVLFSHLIYLALNTQIKLLNLFELSIIIVLLWSGISRIFFLLVRSRADCRLWIISYFQFVSLCNFFFVTLQV